MSCNCIVKNFLSKFSKNKSYSFGKRFSSTTGGNDDAKSAGQPATKPLKKPVTPTGKLDDVNVSKTEYLGSNVLQPFPNNINPETGEVGGPRGLEPTRFGDWERKGRVSDF